MIAQIITAYRQHKAKRELQRIVDERRASFEIQDFARRRAAMLRHTRGTA